MGIVTRHDAVGIPLAKDNSRFNAGMQMVQRQQERDDAMRSSKMQPLKYNTGGTYGGIGVGDQKKKAKPGMGAESVFGVDAVLPQQSSMPSWQQRNEDIISNIQAGMYDVATTRALSDIVNRQNRLMTNQRLSDAQKQDAFNQFEMDKDKMEIALGGFSIGPAMRSNQQSATPTFEQYYGKNRKEYQTEYASAKAELVESGNVSPSTDAIIEKMRQNYDSWADLSRPMQGRATGGIVRPGEDYLVGERGPEVLRMGENGGYVIPNDQLAFANQQQVTPMNPERQVGDYGGSTTFGVPTALMAGPSQPAQPIPPVAAPVQQPPSAPKRSPRKQPVYFNPGSNSVTNTGRSPIYNDAGNFVGDTGLYDQQGAQYIRQQAGDLSPQPGLRKWTSKDGKYSAEGEMIGFRATQGGDPLTSEMVRIRKKDGVEVDVPLYRLSEEDRQMVMSSPQYDYQIRNQRVGGANQQSFNPSSMEYSPTGSNYQQMFDPNNPEYAAMRAPSQQQEQNSGRFMGQYGMGGVDYGINPATGNRVTASVRPGGTMPQYDEPVRVRPKATAQSIDEAMTRAGRARRQQASEEFDRQFPNAIGNPVNIPNSAVTGPVYNPQTDPRMRTEVAGGFADNMAKIVQNSETKERVKERVRARADELDLPQDVKDALNVATGGGPNKQAPKYPSKMSASVNNGASQLPPMQPQQQPAQQQPAQQQPITKGDVSPQAKAWQNWWRTQPRAYQATDEDGYKEKGPIKLDLTSADGKQMLKGAEILQISNRIPELGYERVITIRKPDGSLASVYSNYFSVEDVAKFDEMAERKPSDGASGNKNKPKSAKQKMNDIIKNPKYTES